MGTTAEKLTYLNTTKQNLKTVINTTGAGLTNESTFRSYANVLNDKILGAINGDVDLFEEYPKVSGNGADLSLNGVVEGKMSITPQGNTTQKTSILPSGYTQVDYLKSDGKQCIDTGYAFENPDLKIEGKYRKTSLNGNVFGVDTSTSGSRQMHGNIYARALYLGNSSVVSDITQELDTDYNFSFQFKNNAATWIINDNTYTYQGNNGWKGTTINSALFATNKSATFNPNFLLKGRIYYAKFYDNNDNLVRDFIPCYRNSDNEVGMYDLVNDVFYTNQGTGAFTYGSVVSIPNPSYPFPVKTVTGENSLVISNSDNSETQNYQLSLGNIELCKIGDYQDSIVKDNGKWYLKKEIGKVVLDGSENWLVGKLGTNSYGIKIANIKPSKTNVTNPIYLIANLFKGISFDDRTTGSNIAYSDVASSNTRLYIRNTNYTSITNFKAMLETTNLIVYYVLATPTYEEITDSTLISQLNNIYNNAHSYNGVTNITTTYEDGNEQMYLDIEALKNVWDTSL